MAKKRPGPGRRPDACCGITCSHRERGAAHLYRLQVTYDGNVQTVLWVLFRPYGWREVRAEAAFQRFILGWLSTTALRLHNLGRSSDQPHGRMKAPPPH